uniref:Uncharacterized protein n=1 Tax=Cacopsylla melanoneura TaxID=428564 RepID=A0A8D8M2W1_9HEMI
MYFVRFSIIIYFFTMYFLFCFNFFFFIAQLFIIVFFLTKVIDSNCHYLPKVSTFQGNKFKYGKFVFSSIMKKKIREVKNIKQVYVNSEDISVNVLKPTFEFSCLISSIIVQCS